MSVNTPMGGHQHANMGAAETLSNKYELLSNPGGDGPGKEDSFYRGTGEMMDMAPEMRPRSSLLSN